jgi:hypothetical protein
VDLGIRGAGAQVVAVEGDVDVAERDLGLEQVLDELVDPLCQVRTAPVDADKGYWAAGVLLHDLVRDAYERASDVVLVQDDALLVGHMDLPGLTGPG